MSATPAVCSLNPNPNPNPSPCSQPDRDGWTIVDRSRRRGSRPLSTAGTRRPSGTQAATSDPFPLHPTPWTPADPILDLARSASILRKMESTISRLEKSRFYSRFVASLSCSEIRDGLSRIRASESGAAHLLPIRLVAYGVGSVESYPAPRIQLALITLLRRRLGAAVESAEIFDPVLSAAECHVVEQLGFKVMPVNEHGCRKVTLETPTLFFMPHCEAVLYDSLLRTNWDLLGLRRMAVIGNSFMKYARYVSEAGESVGSVKIKEVARCMLESRKFVKEVAIEWEINGEEAGLDLFQALHDTSWHFFDVDDRTDLVKLND